MLQLYFTAVAYLAQLAAAHGGALNYTVGDTWYAGYDPFGPKDQDDAPYIVQRKWITNEPIFETTNASLACNFPGNPARAYIPINAGENITAVYNTWVHTVGPMIAWLTPCANNDCSTFDPAGAEWFKIGQQGLLWGTIEGGGWFQKEFSRWDGSPSLWSERIPETLRAGKYLVRHEIISLHSAHKPQFYPECAHLDVKGSGTGFPTKEFMAKIPGVYSMDRKFAVADEWPNGNSLFAEPEINIDVYDPEISTKTEYKIPGPLVWTG